MKRLSIVRNTQNFKVEYFMLNREHFIYRANMGNSWSRGGGQQQQQQLDVEGQQQQQRQGVEAVHRGNSGVKRSHVEENDEEDEIDTLMRTPKKKKLKTTSRYKDYFSDK